MVFRAPGPPSGVIRVRGGSVALQPGQLIYLPQSTLSRQGIVSAASKQEFTLGDGRIDVRIHRADAVAAVHVLARSGAIRALTRS